MNILLNLVSPGLGNCSQLLLVPRPKLEGINLDAINGIEVQQKDTTDEIRDTICNLFCRAGLDNEGLGEQDLKQYLNPKPPFIVDRVVTCYFSV